MTMTRNRNKMEHLQQGLDAATSKAAIDHLYIDNRNWILKLPPLAAIINRVCDTRDDTPE
jgi:hypothetical protein